MGGKVLCANTWEGSGIHKVSVWEPPQTSEITDTWGIPDAPHVVGSADK